ncbi:hypothetical protein NUW58_g5069 [Xylaria curta]|uniref:Uncharacterized protein n=1 Tax=Xylaria curta TaxID=42375 RepID=A0ACC1P4Z6_9PEZI|nr:hypothetical protein NUW58_g5069 [Xylaria curta]
MSPSIPRRSPWLYCLGVIQIFLTLAFAQFPWAKAIPRTGWTVTADSFQPGYEAAKAIDGNSSTFWHTAYSQHTVTLSNDGTTWSSPVQFGTWLNDRVTKSTFFSNTTARYLRITAQTEAQGANNQWSSMAELNVYSPDVNLDASAFRPPPISQGRWDSTVVLPLVAAAGALSAQGNVIFWSAFRPDLFGGGTGQTLTALWTPSSQTVTQRSVTETRHDMFCPGISLDANGRIIVTGGSDANNTSVFDPANAGWTAAPKMVIARGYQSSVTIGDGRIFTIGVHGAAMDLRSPAVPWPLCSQPTRKAFTAPTTTLGCSRISRTRCSRPGPVRG